MERTRRDVSFYQHAAEFAASAWPSAAAKTRVSIIETLIRVVPVVVRDLAGRPEPALTREGCHLPRSGWGYLIFADSSPAPGKAYTDDGQVHEHRGLKGRTKGRPSPRARGPVRKVPIPPELVELLRAHIQTFGVAPAGRLFRSERGNPLQPSTWWQVWQKVRAVSLTPEQLASPLMKRPYDLRHSGVTWRLNSGVPATEVAAWAGHSTEMLMRVYARCVAGLEDVWIGRMDEALHLGEEP